jgi:MFS family permease
MDRQWRYRDTVLVLCMLAFFVTYFARLAISPVVPLITADFDISNTRVGLALTGMWLAYGVAQFPSGVLADRFGERRVILLAVGGTTAASVLLAFAPLYPVFVACAVGLGLAAGLHYSVASTLLSRTYDDVGTALGIHSLGGPLAGFVAPVAAAWVGVRYGWAPAVALAAAVGVPVFLLFRWRVRPTAPRRPSEPMRDRLQVGSLRRTLARPRIAFPLVVAMVGTYVVQGLMSFLPTFLVEFRGASPTHAGAVFSAFFVVRAGAQVVLGRTSDRYGRDASIAVAMLAGSLGTALLVVGAGLPAVSAAVLLAGVGASFFTSIDPRFLDALDDRERGAGFGLVRTVYTVVGATGSVGVGLTADLFGWDASFAVLTALFLLAFLSLATNRLLGLGY